MGQIYPQLDSALIEWIKAQHVFFVSTAPLTENGHINCSPKGLDGSFAVTGPNEVAYLDLTGSGAETIAHLRENGRITIMFCAFEGKPRILRLYGQGEVVYPHHPDFDALSSHIEKRTGTRSIIRIKVSRIADSCGYGVPLMDFQKDREALTASHARKGEDALQSYREEKNRISLDGLPAWNPDSQKDLI